MSLPGLKTGPEGAKAWLVLQRVFALPFGAKGLRGLSAGKQEAELGVSPVNPTVTVCGLPESSQRGGAGKAATCGSWKARRLEGAGPFQCLLRAEA